MTEVIRDEEVRSRIRHAEEFLDPRTSIAIDFARVKMLTIRRGCYGSKVS